MTLQLYGIPNCGTCKKAFDWLVTHGVEYEFIDTKLTPPTRDMVQSWVTALGARPLRNTSGQAYRALGEERTSWSDQQWVDAFAQNAMLMKRPVFVKDGEAIMVGFKAKEEDLQALLSADT